MRQTFLYLNSSKTEVIQIGTLHQIQQQKILNITYSGHNIYLSERLINAHHPHIPFSSVASRLCPDHLQNLSAYLPMPAWTRSCTMGDRAFSCAAPRLWNKLPPHLKAPQTLTHFKRGLKTFLFIHCF
ncbi:hypothetical protein ATANTOWER_008228 [Ataeniobius toweri]|uniref:Uncharacterized protein n=1 Tax=Ataeniobius toweri TaxID=208326 RepID=A0ABU7BS23_9TELE|nr:hypothetical protein [Ataeniobius toweri]